MDGSSTSSPVCTDTIPRCTSSNFGARIPALAKPSCLPANRLLTRRAGDTGLPANILTSNMVAGSSPHPTVVPYASQRCYLQGSSRKATLLGALLYPIVHRRQLQIKIVAGPRLQDS